MANLYPTSELDFFLSMARGFRGKPMLMKARTQIPATSGSLHFQWGYPGYNPVNCC